MESACPYGVAGDHLWVKETHAFYSLNYEETGKWHPTDRDVCCHYREGCPVDMTEKIDRWRPSIFMPRWASRTTLEIVNVRAERLQAISAEDILAEGAVERLNMDPNLGKCPISAFDGKCYADLRSLWSHGWESINGKGSWAANPWVWVLTFRLTPT